MKRWLSVIRKLGIPVLMTSQPLNMPMEMLTPSASAMATKTLSPTVTASVEVTIAAVTTATPDDRSNSPPIISSDTATAIRPIVALWYRIVDIAAQDRNGSAI